MINPTTHQTLPSNHLVIINSNLQVWSGTVKVQREQDLPDVDQDKLPPKTLVSDGRKVLIDSKELAGMESVRKAIERFLKEEGFSFRGAGGIAVTHEKYEEFMAKAPEFEQNFKDALDTLIKRLPEAYQAQEDKYPDWAFMLAQSRPTDTQIRNRCKFGLGIFQLAPPDPKNPGSTGNAYYQDMLDQALPEMLKSISAAADKQLEKVRGKSRMLQSQLDNVRGLVKKLKAFAFLNDDIAPAADALAAVLTKLPLQGTLNMANTLLCVTVLEQLANPHQLLANGKAALEDHLQQEDDLFVQPELSIPATDDVTVADPVLTTPVVSAPARRRGLTMTM